MWSHSRMAARRASTTCSCAAARTTLMRLSGGLGCREEDLVRERGPAWAFPCTAGPCRQSPASGQIDSKSDASYSRMLIHSGGSRGRNRRPACGDFPVIEP